MEAEVLPAAPIESVLRQRYRFVHVDVDRAPLWMDLPGVVGLPSLVFFNREGRHVITQSGYRTIRDLELKLRVIADRMERGELKAYSASPLSRLGTDGITPAQAQAELTRLFGAIYLKINDNDGGFRSPSKHPFPLLLLELQRWYARGGPKRLDRWIGLTAKHALDGTSPRLTGEALPDMDFDRAELARLSRRGAAAGPRWREGIDRLPVADPYRGIQDQVDGGVFRYASGPGWYHPHFERSAAANIAWSMLLDIRGQGAQAQRIARFVLDTFGQGELLATYQASDPFYYRLRAAERAKVAAPAVDNLWTLKVQAIAARKWPARCHLLQRVGSDRWPSAHWDRSGEQVDRVDAPPDAVGELLIALSACRDQASAQLASSIAGAVTRRWAAVGLPQNGRLHRLAAGICTVDDQLCRRALATLVGLPLDLEHPPALVALATVAAQPR